VIKYILDSINLQVFANTFILNDVRIKTHMRMKAFIHEKEDQENDWEQNVIVNKLNHE